MIDVYDPASITVVIPTFNRRRLLERALSSVLDERRVPVRVHVQDNASPDDTEAFMRDLVARDPRVSYARNATNIGTANQVEVFKAVRTRYFVPLADDDYFLPEFLVDAYAIVQADPELGAVAFYTEARDEDGRVVNLWPNHAARWIEGKRQPADHLREWMTGSHYAWQSVLWRSDVLTYIGAPYAHTGMPSDVDFQAQIFAKFPVYVVRRPGAVFSVHAGQASNGLSMADVPSWAKLFARLDTAIEALDVFSPEEYRQLRAVMWQRMRPSWLRTSKVPLSMAALARIMSSAGFRLGDWELAFHLAGEIKKLEGDAPRVRAERELNLPVHVPKSSGEPGRGRRLDLGVQMIQWLQGSLQREQALSNQINALSSSLKVMQEAALAVTADRNRLASQLAALGS